MGKKYLYGHDIQQFVVYFFNSLSKLCPLKLLFYKTLNKHI